MAPLSRKETGRSAPTNRLDVEDVDSDVRMDGVYFFRSAASYPFRKALDAGDYAYCFMVRRGNIRLTTEFPLASTIDLGPGDIVGVSGLTPHAFQSLPVVEGLETSSFERFEISDAPDRNSDVELILGVVPQESIALSNMVLGPIYLNRSSTPECARRIWKAAELLEEEFQGPGQEYSQSIIVRRIAEIILINMTRSLLMRRGTETYSLPPLINSGGILTAIQRFMTVPFESWTVERLARISGMSRTKFAEEFRRITGRTPIQTLSRIRLTMIARRLLTEGMSIDEAADIAGYSSSAAFIRAFTRAFGMTPLKWRSSQRIESGSGR